MRIAVTGASGRIGGQVVDLPAADRDHDVIAISRREASRPSSAAVRVAVADYDDLSALYAALRGVDTLVFVSSDGEAWRVIAHVSDQVARITGTAPTSVEDVLLREVPITLVVDGLDRALAEPQ